MSWNDGSFYKGDWVNGIQHGFGRMLFANGETKEGLFENGVFKIEGTEAEIREHLKRNSKNTNQNLN